MCSVCTGYNVTATALNTYLNAHVSNTPTIITNAELHTSYKLTDIKCANMISLGVLKGAWGWLADVVGVKGLAFEIQGGINSVCDNRCAAGQCISNVCFTVAGEEIHDFSSGCQLYCLIRTASLGLPHWDCNVITAAQGHNLTGSL